MERDFEALDELFDSIIEDIKDPKSAAQPRTLDLSVDKNGLGFSEAVSVIKVSISDDKMTAYASVVAGGANPRRRTFDEIMAAIKGKGVVYGIDEEAVRSVADGVFDRSVEIARGTPPIDGTDGELEHLYDCSNGKEVKNIDVNTVICRIKEPVKGKSGRNVIGEKLPAADGKPAPNLAGENIEITENDELITRASGTLALRDGLYSIINEMIIDNDVHASMGIVSFVGTIIVRGNVRDKSVIRAGKSVIVMGYAFGSVIEAGSDITISKSCENTVVVAKSGFVKGRDFTGCAVSAGTFIEAASLVDSKVSAVNYINCVLSGGSISGGDVECIGPVSCLVLGTRRRDLTVINVGDDTKYREMLRKNERQLKFVNSEISKVNARIEKLEKDKKSGDITLDDDNFLVAAVSITEQLAVEKEQAQKRVKETEAIIELSKTSQITVKMMLYSNVAIQLRGESMTTEMDYSDVTVTENGHGLVIT